MRTVVGLPPLFDDIDAAFGVRDRAIIFAFGDTIYNPAGVPITPELEAHEQVHGKRQGDAVHAWWFEYIKNPIFRLEEELPAHVAEFQSLCAQHRSRWHSERNMRRTLAAHVARKLSAPLYGRLVTFEAAKKFLLAVE